MGITLRRPFEAAIETRITVAVTTTETGLWQILNNGLTIYSHNSEIERVSHWDYDRKFLTVDDVSVLLYSKVKSVSILEISKWYNGVWLLLGMAGAGLLIWFITNNNSSCTGYIQYTIYVHCKFLCLAAAHCSRNSPRIFLRTLVLYAVTVNYILYNIHTGPFLF